MLLKTGVGELVEKTVGTTDTGESAAARAKIIWASFGCQAAMRFGAAYERRDRRQQEEADRRRVSNET
jgi:hypothetical protein